MLLQLFVPEFLVYDETLNEFRSYASRNIVMQHSLLSLSKWEGFYEKPFLNQTVLSPQEEAYYFRAMCVSINRAPPLEFWLNVPKKVKSQIYAHIHRHMTATKLAGLRSPVTRRPITSELIYSWMVSLNVPVEFEKWHLNRLLVFIDLHSRNLQRQRGKRKRLTVAQQADMSRLNDMRKKAAGSTG